MSDSEDRQIAIDSYNRAQDLLHIEGRTPEQNHELLEAALTSRHHWRLVGGEMQFAISDWLMSRIYVQFKEPRLAVEFALSAVSHDQTGFPAWLRASLNEGLARAYQCAGKNDDAKEYKELALTELKLETNPVEKEIILKQIEELN